MPSSPAEVAVHVRDLVKTYKDVVAVNGLGLDVGTGECFALLGPNGAGKTTTIEICEGLTAPDSGTVEILGLRWDRDAATLRERLGIQLQETQLSEKLTVMETARLFRSFFRQGPSAAEAIALVQLEEKRDARVGALSGGQKQRLALACALIGDPALLFLDEPTTGLGRAATDPLPPRCADARQVHPDRVVRGADPAGGGRSGPGDAAGRRRLRRYAGAGRHSAG